jgi:hypothetical protein
MPVILFIILILLILLLLISLLILLLASLLYCRYHWYYWCCYGDNSGILIIELCLLDWYSLYIVVILFSDYCYMLLMVLFSYHYYWYGCYIAEIVVLWSYCVSPLPVSLHCGLSPRVSVYKTHARPQRYRGLITVSYIVDIIGITAIIILPILLLIFSLVLLLHCWFYWYSWFGCGYILDSFIDVAEMIDIIVVLFVILLSNYCYTLILLLIIFLFS